MIDIVYTELREKIQEISTIADASKLAEGYEMLADAVEKMMYYRSEVHKYGFLELEIKAEEIECDHIEDESGPLYGMSMFLNEEVLGDRSPNRALHDMLMSAVDYEPEIVEEVFLTRYFTGEYPAFEAIRYLVYLEGVVCIRKEYPKYAMQALLLHFIPPEAGKIYINKVREKEIEKREKENDSSQDLDMSVVEKYYVGDIPVAPDHFCYPRIKLVDDLIRSIDDRGLQRILREVDFQILTDNMSVISGESRHRIFINMSQKLAWELANDMDSKHVEDIPRALNSFLTVVSRLVSQAEIVLPDDIEEAFSKITLRSSGISKVVEKQVQEAMEDFRRRHGIREGSTKPGLNPDEDQPDD